MRYPFEYCQECGEQIGWTGRFFQFLHIPLHKCYDPSKPYKGRIVLDNFGGSRWVNVNEYFRSEKGKKLLDDMDGISKRHDKKNDERNECLLVNLYCGDIVSEFDKLLTDMRQSYIKVSFHSLVDGWCYKFIIVNYKEQKAISTFLSYKDVLTNEVIKLTDEQLNLLIDLFLK